MGIGNLSQEVHFGIQHNDKTDRVGRKKNGLV